MPQIITVLDDGKIFGYDPLETFAKKNCVTAHALRKEIERGHLNPLVIGEGPDRKYYFPKDCPYVKPKRGRPKKEDES